MAKTMTGTLTEPRQHLNVVTSPQFRGVFFLARHFSVGTGSFHSLNLDISDVSSCGMGVNAVANCCTRLSSLHIFFVMRYALCVKLVMDLNV